MPDIATNEPMEITAGDTVKWTRSLSDYLASDGWVLTYALRNEAGSIDITASADGDNHLVDVAASVTAGWPAGSYSWHGYVTKAAERYSVDTGHIEIKQNLAATVSHDGRSHVKKVLDAIEAVLEERATEKQLAYSINGRTLSLTPLAELYTLRSQYIQEYRREVNAERLANGLGSSRKVLTRFKGTA